MLWYNINDMEVNMYPLLVVNDLPSIGKVALSSIVPITTSLGIETSSLPTVILSSHTGFKDFYKKDLTVEMCEILNHFENLNLSFDTILTGYFYNETQLQYFIDHMPVHNRLVVDPVFADYGRRYSGFSVEYAETMLKLCRKAQLILPNLTEACLLADVPYLESYNQDDIEKLLQKLRNLGCNDILITGIEFNNEIGIMFYINNEIGYTSYPKINTHFYGSGDILAGLISALTMKGYSIKKSISLSLNFLNHCLLDTLKLNRDIKYGIAFEKNLKLLQELNGELYEKHK